MADDQDDKNGENDSNTEQLVALLIGPPHGHKACWIPMSVRASGHGPVRQKVPKWPAIDLHCHHCDGTRRFSAQWLRADLSNSTYANEAASLGFAVYGCRNCGLSTVRMALQMTETTAESGEDAFFVTKIGQEPPYRPPTSRRVQRFLVGPDDLALYRKGQLAEAQGLGLAALAYYRRVIENLRTALIQQLIAVAQQVGEARLVPNLESAAQNWQFQSSIDEVAPAIPERLFIAGQNPLRLLHAAFSNGVHNLADDECLGEAIAARQVLQELIDRIGAVLSDNTELQSAVGRLTRAAARRGGNKPDPTPASNG